MIGFYSQQVNVKPIKIATTVARVMAKCFTWLKSAMSSKEEKTPRQKRHGSGFTMNW